MDEIINYKKFYELMSSYGLLPQNLQPTREIGNSATIFTNIYIYTYTYTYNNSISNSTQSGNILTDFSDHYSQFIVVNREKLDIKSLCTVVIILNFQSTALMMFDSKLLC